jgi:hypothetical protein
MIGRHENCIAGDVLTGPTIMRRKNWEGGFHAQHYDQNLIVFT